MIDNDLLGSNNTGVGMKIVMKKDTTEKIMELAKELYPNAIIVKDTQGE